MRTLFLADLDFATRERTMLRRLQIGLLDEGVRLLEAMPHDAPDLEGNPLVPTLTYRPRGSRLTRGHRVRSLIQQLGEVEPSLATSDNPDDLLDIIHVWGAESWPVALDVAEATGAALAIECWSAATVRAIRATERRALGLRGVWLAPNVALHTLADRHAQAWPVHLARWGVQKPEHIPPHSKEAHPPGLAIIGSGRDAADHTAVLDALAETAEEYPELLAFLDAPIVERRPQVWRHADRLGILDRVSVIADMECHREAVLQADFLLLPEAHGEARSIILDAMAARTVVVARPDPLIEAFNAPDSAVLVEGPTRGAWVKALRRVIDDPDEARVIGATARERILAERPVHQQVDAILAAHNLLVADDSLAFPDGSRAS